MKIIYKGGRRNIDPDVFFPAPPWALNELISNIEKAWNPNAIFEEIESYLNLRIAEEARLFEEYRKGYIEQLTKRGPDFEQIETSTLLKRREIEKLKENRKRVKENGKWMLKTEQKQRG